MLSYLSYSLDFRPRSCRTQFCGNLILFTNLDPISRQVHAISCRTRFSGNLILFSILFFWQVWTQFFGQILWRLLFKYCGDSFSASFCNGSAFCHIATFLAQSYIYYFLSDPGVPGVRSMGPVVSHKQTD